MMSYEQIKNLTEKEFKRFCGVKPKLFEEMVLVLKSQLPKQKQRGGQPKLSPEDQLLIALQYWREYRTYFHIGQSWRVHESTVCRIVHRVEDYLIKSGNFSLPGKKALLNPETEWSVVIVDVGETPIERPKKAHRPLGGFLQVRTEQETKTLLQRQEKETYLKISGSN
jgi:hypothetical protein